MRLKDKIAVITGASKGIGKGIAQRFAREGATVVLASRSLDLLSNLADEINGAGGRALALSLDVSKHENVQQVVDTVVGEFGKLDIMVNNAGISMTVPSKDITPEQWRQAVETDLFGVWYCCQSAGKQMIAQNGGCIINITSMNGQIAFPMRAPYCASKAAGNMLTKVLAIEWAEHNVRVNSIAPGYIRTELVQDLIDRGVLSVNAIEKRTPQGQIGKVDDIAGAAVYLASDESSFVTGSILTVDGGWTAYGYM